MHLIPSRLPLPTCVLAAALAMASLVWCPGVLAYELTGRSWPQSERGAPVTLTYSYSNLLDGGLLNASEQSVPPHEIRTAVEEALSVWAGVAPLHFLEVPDQGDEPPTGNYPRGEFGTIRLGHRPIDGMGNVKGLAYFPPLSGQTLSCTICGDVHFDVLDRWETVGTLDLPDLLGAAIHEIGHSLGLAHTPIEEANMHPVFRRHTGPGSGWLHPDDIAGIQALYGAGVGSVTPLLHVPEPTAWLLLIVGAAGLASARLRNGGWSRSEQ